MGSNGVVVFFGWFSAIGSAGRIRGGFDDGGLVTGRWRGLEEWPQRSVACFFAALGEFRALFGVHITQISVKYGIDVDESLVSIFPLESLGDVE